MKISGLNFLSDLEKRLLASICGAPGSSRLEFQRLLNFPDKTLVIQVGWPGVPLGKLTCRVVDETQDFYFRGTFQPASSDPHYPFTLRPGKDYEKDMSLLVETIAESANRAKPPVPSTAEPVLPEDSASAPAKRGPRKKSVSTEEKSPPETGMA